MKLVGSLLGVSRRFRLWYYCWASQYDRRKHPTIISLRNLNHQPHNAANLKIQNSNATSKLYLSFPTTSTSIMGQNKTVPVQNFFGPNVLNISNQQHNGTKVFWEIRIQMWLKNMLESLWDLHATQWGERFLGTQNSNTTTLKRCGHTILKTYNHKLNDTKWFFKVKCDFKCKMDPLCLKVWLVDCSTTAR